jgi:hypothetical protein
MHMLHKGQVEGLAKGDVLAQNRVINQLFRLAASRELTSRSSRSNEFLQHNLAPRLQLELLAPTGQKCTNRPHSM